MKRLFALLLLVALVPSAQAAIDDETDFGEGYYVRMAKDDIPRTGPTEGPGWNVVEYVRVQHDGNRTEIPLLFGQGVTPACSCPSIAMENNVAVIGADVEAGEHLVALRHSHPDGEAFSLPLAAFTASRAGNASVNVYVPQGMQPTSNAPASVEGLPATQKAASIWQYQGTSEAPLPAGFWLVVAPKTVSNVVGPDVAPGDGGFDWLALALGIFGGIIIWSFLVQRGLVQKRRRQAVARAAHAEAAGDPLDVLEGRKRALMAALKELELAKMNKELDTQAYDALKGEFKRAAVTTMRALEERE